MDLNERVGKEAEAGHGVTTNWTIEGCSTETRADSFRASWLGSVFRFAAPSSRSWTRPNEWDVKPTLMPLPATHLPSRTAGAFSADYCARSVPLDRSEPSPSPRPQSPVSKTPGRLMPATGIAWTLRFLRGGRSLVQA